MNKTEEKNNAVFGSGSPSAPVFLPLFPNQGTMKAGRQTEET